MPRSGRICVPNWSADDQAVLRLICGSFLPRDPARGEIPSVFRGSWMPQCPSSTVPKTSWNLSTSNLARWRVCTELTLADTLRAVSATVMSLGTASGGMLPFLCGRAWLYCWTTGLPWGG